MKSNKNDRASIVKSMFQKLAGSYDLANRWMTWGQDVKWRCEVIDRAHLTEGATILDVGTGTGDLALEAVSRNMHLWVAGLDFTPEMMQVGRSRMLAEKVVWLCGDAMDLPFNEFSFDVVVSGYLLRNVNSIDRALREQYRVLKTGGRVVCLDTTPPPQDWLHFPVRVYLRRIIPLLGGLISGDINAYRYLPSSTSHFLKAPELAQQLHLSGFKEVGFRTFMGGSMAIHWGVK